MEKVGTVSYRRQNREIEGKGRTVRELLVDASTPSISTSVSISGRRSRSRPIVESFDPFSSTVVCSQDNSSEIGVREGWAKWIAVVDSDEPPVEVLKSIALPTNLSLVDETPSIDAAPGTMRLYAEKTDEHPDLYLDVLYRTSVRADCTDPSLKRPVFTVTDASEGFNCCDFKDVVPVRLNAAIV